MTAIIATHKSDPDGIIASAELQFEYNPETILFVRYDSLLENFTKLSKEVEASFEPAGVYIADISINKALEQSGLIERIAKDAKSVTWYDHHRSTVQKKTLLESLGVQVHYSGSQCAARLISKEHDHEGYMRKLSDIAQISDMGDSKSKNDKAIIARKLEKIISLANANEDEETIMVLSTNLRFGAVIQDGPTLYDSWEKKVAQYDWLAPEKIRKLQESAIKKQVGDYTVVFTLCPPLLLPKIGPRILGDLFGKTTDVQVLLNEAPFRNHQFRSKSGGYDVAGFADQFPNGGGRGNGSGIVLEEQIHEENYVKKVEEISEMMRTYIRK